MTSNLKPKQSQPVNVRYGKGLHWRAHIGYILIPNDDLIEEEMFRLAPAGVGVHFSRIPGADACTAENLMAMQKNLAETAARFVFEDDLAVVCFACTSASALIGEERVLRELSHGAPKAKPTSIISGVVRALRSFNAHRIVVATPYLDEINFLEEKYLTDQGFEIVNIQGMNILSGADMYRVTPEFILEYVRALDRPDAEAIFISCGGIRSLEIVDELERQIKKPVITSNQAMFWDTMRLAGIKDKIDGYGMLLKDY